MNKILVGFTLLLVILGLSSVFGTCWYKAPGGTDQNYNFPDSSHRCEKINSNFCYFPRTDNTLAPQKNTIPLVTPNHPILQQKFSSKYGGCGIPEYNYEDKKLKIRAKDVRVDEIRNFLNSCGSYNFDIQTDLTYKL